MWLYRNDLTLCVYRRLIISRLLLAAPPSVAIISLKLMNLVGINLATKGVESERGNNNK